VLRSAFLHKKSHLIPEPGQRVRLRTGRGRWRGNFRAVSYPYTHEQLGVVVRIAEEGEYWEDVRQGRRTFGMPWPAHQIDVVLLCEEDANKKTQELPQRLHQEPERVEPRPGGVEAQEGAGQMSWWRRMFGG
jgi:hypothetical protein